MNDELKPQSFDLEAWRARMTQPTESPDERAARKAVEKRARELSMSTEALAWFMGLENKLLTLASIIDEQNVKLARQDERLQALVKDLDRAERVMVDMAQRIAALEHPQPKLWRAGQ